MKRHPADLTRALEALPLFPLKQVVLFPDMLLPLHVFEPRYVTMIEEAMKTHRCIAPVLVSDQRADMRGRPAFEPCATVGTIIDYAPLPGDRIHIVLRGRRRVLLEELPFEPPYRRARGQIIEAIGASVPDSSIASLHHAAGAFAQLIRDRDPNFKLELPEEARPEDVADALAHQLLLDASARQMVLAATDEAERVRIVTETLSVQLATLLGPGSDVLN